MIVWAAMSRKLSSRSSSRSPSSRRASSTEPCAAPQPRRGRDSARVPPIARAISGVEQQRTDALVSTVELVASSLVPASFFSPGRRTSADRLHRGVLVVKLVSPAPFLITAVRQPVDLYGVVLHLVHCPWCRQACWCRRCSSAATGKKKSPRTRLVGHSGGRRSGRSLFLIQIIASRTSARVVGVDKRCRCAGFCPSSFSSDRMRYSRVSFGARGFGHTLLRLS